MTYGLPTRHQYFQLIRAVEAALCSPKILKKKKSRGLSVDPIIFSKPLRYRSTTSDCCDPLYAECFNNGSRDSEVFGKRRGLIIRNKCKWTGH